MSDINIETLLLIEPRLVGLINRAREAGQQHVGWWACWSELMEELSHVVGHGCHCEELRSDHCYTIARWAIHQAWQGRPIVSEIDIATTFPWQAGWGTSADDEPITDTTAVSSQ